MGHRRRHARAQVLPAYGARQKAIGRRGVEMGAGCERDRPRASARGVLIMSIWKRLKEFGPWSRASLERDLEREIQNHLALEAEESAGRAAFGNIPLVKEDVR